MNNDYNLNWYNYKSFEPKDMSNYGMGYSYNPNAKPIGFDSSNIEQAKDSWASRAWNNTKSFLPQSYGEAGALLSGVGSIWGAIAGAKAAKDANELARDNLDEIKKRNKKIDEDNEKFSKSIDDVWNRE